MSFLKIFYRLMKMICRHSAWVAVAWGSCSDNKQTIVINYFFRIKWFYNYK